MRKRIVITLLGIVVLGVVALVFSQPKKGSVAYHLRAYREAQDKRFGRQWRFMRWYYYSPPTLSETEEQALATQMTKHKEALVKLGYLLESRFVVSNRSARSTYRPILTTALREFPDSVPFLTFRFDGTNMMVITVRPQDAPKLERSVREVDVPLGEATLK